MPAFVINTNVSRDRVTENFITELSALVAKLTGKPESVSMRVIFCRHANDFAPEREQKHFTTVLITK